MSEAANKDLPVFKYFPDPVGAGSIEESSAACVCCNAVRGYIYVRTPFATGDYNSKLCPWCIADGSASKLIGGVFSSVLGLGGELEQWDEVSADVVDEVTRRTPGFWTLQNDQWYTHCGDAAVFLGHINEEQLIAKGQEVTRDFIECLGEESYEDFLEWGTTELLHMMKDGGEGQGYLFRCRHCGKHGGFVDYT